MSLSATLVSPSVSRQSPECICGNRPPRPWAVAIICVPEGWIPNSWRAMPPGVSANLSHSAAWSAARVMNRQRIDRAAKTGNWIRSWSVVCQNRRGFGVLSVDVRGGFDPKSVDDMPPCVQMIEATEKQVGEVVKSMNRELLDSRRWALLLNSITPEESADRFADKSALFAASEPIECVA